MEEKKNRLPDVNRTKNAHRMYSKARPFGEKFPKAFFPTATLPLPHQRFQMEGKWMFYKL